VPATAGGQARAAAPGRWRQRLPTHAAAAAFGAACVGVALLLVPGNLSAITLGTGYASVGLLAVTLLIGPLRTVRGRPDPVHLYPRRDVGLWAFALASAHTVVGLRVHFDDEPWRYFARSTASGLRPLTDLFGISNWIGFGSVVVLTAVAVTSNDLALRTLRRSRWKRVQRLAIAGAVLAAAHTVGYQVHAHRTLVLVAAFAAVVVLVSALRIAARRT
jgi:DMSO/TMAO reductase YedYZ heme-binding membrane subunit